MFLLPMAMKDDCIRKLQLKRKSVTLSLRNINFGYFIVESIRREDIACMHFGPIVSRWPRFEVVKERHWERVYAFSPNMVTSFRYGWVTPAIMTSTNGGNDLASWKLHGFCLLKCRGMVKIPISRRSLIPRLYNCKNWNGFEGEKGQKKRRRFRR